LLKQKGDLLSKSKTKMREYNFEVFDNLNCLNNSKVVGISELITTIRLNENRVEYKQIRDAKQKCIDSQNDKDLLSINETHYKSLKKLRHC
jgi:hypothetical protein